MATEKIQGYEFAINMDDGGMTRTLREIKNEAKLNFLQSGIDLGRRFFCRAAAACRLSNNCF